MPGGAVFSRARLGVLGVAPFAPGAHRATWVFRGTWCFPFLRKQGLDKKKPGIVFEKLIAVWRADPCESNAE